MICSASEIFCSTHTAPCTHKYVNYESKNSTDSNMTISKHPTAQYERTVTHSVKIEPIITSLIIEFLIGILIHIKINLKYLKGMYKLTVYCNSLPKS